MTFLLKKYRIAGASALAVTTLMLAQSGVAHAGFDWTPPVTPTKNMNSDMSGMNATAKGPLTPELDAPIAAPVATVDTATLPVVPDHGKEAVGMKSLPRKAQPVEDTISNTPPVKPEPIPAESDYVDTQPAKPVAQEPLVIDNTQPSTPAPEPTVQASTDTSSQQVQGFGSDIPLAMALRDIVPSGYAYAFANGSVAGTRISWQGGRPWMVVLNEALAPKGLVATTEGQVVRIAPTNTAWAPQHAPIAAPMAPSEPPTAANKPLDLTSTTPATAPAATPAKSYSARDMVVDMHAHNKWQARPGSTLHEVLKTWSNTAKVDLQWVTPYDFPINNAFVFEGTFNEAISSLLASYAGETPRPRGRLYPNAPDGPSVLMIN